MRQLLAAVGVLIAIMLLAGCAGTTAPSAPALSSTPPSAASTIPSSAAAAAFPGRWAVSTLAQATDVQAAVDPGRQPWLLDPEEVATSYASAELGWSAPQAVRSGRGVGLRDPARGRLVTVTIVQPVRQGPTGIWVVTATTSSG